MSKGLTLARIFYRAGHRVIGADFEPYFVPVPGHFSTSLDTFYRLSSPTSDKGSAKYIRDLVDVIKKENVELWVSCSGESSTTADGEAAEVIEKETKCKAIQFGPNLTETLHNKHSFISHTIQLGLNVPDTHLITSETEGLVVLYPEKPRPMSFIMKTVRFDGPTHADMTIMPRASFKETEAHIRELNPTPFRPFVLQQYVAGPEYCTHALVIRGEIRAFVACPSANLLMHYQPLAASSLLSQAMLLYTSIYVRRTSDMTGHFCLDFLIEESLARASETRDGASEKEVRELMEKINPIECNPRPNTAVICFEDVSEDMASAYLSVLPDHEPKGMVNVHSSGEMVVPESDIKGYYFIGHDLVTRILLPLLSFTRFEVGVSELVSKWMEFLEHVLYWRDAVWEVWDPWPAWWLYVGYLPGVFALAIWKGRWWSRVNISTGKMFGCR